VLTKGAEVAGFLVDRVIGTGRKGTTYLARHSDIPGHAALTIIDADLFDDPGFRERFTQEAGVASGLTHPNIAAVYGHGITDDGTPWIATQYVAGTDAETALRQGRMTPAKAVLIVSEIALALDFAHRRGLVHRDIRPANFLLSTDDPGGYVLLSSFGNAQPVEYKDSAALMSALTYAAPELLSGATVDGRADLYSLGGSLFRLLTGRTPFPAAEDPATAVQQHLQDPPPKVTDTKPKLPPALNAVVATAMAKNPDARYQTGEEFAAALNAILPRQDIAAAGSAVAAPPPVAPPRPAPAAPPVPVSAPLPAPVPTLPPPPPIRRETRPAPSPTPSWHPDPDVEPPDPGQFPGPVPPAGRPGRRPVKAGAALLAVTALVVGGVIWLTSGGEEGSTPAAGPTTSTTTSGTKSSSTTTSSAPATRDPAAETTLRGLLPIGYTPDACRPTDPTEGARATMTCAPNRDPGGPTAARYSLMPSADTLSRAFNKLVAESSTVICPGNIMSPGAWRHNATPDQVAGTVFCATKGTEQLVAWTTDDTLLLNVVSSADAAPTLEELFAWWGSHS
jgi:serine/threonine-protein kinase